MSKPALVGIHVLAAIGFAASGYFFHTGYSGAMFCIGEAVAIIAYVKD